MDGWTDGELAGGGAEEEEPRRSSWVRCGAQTKDGATFLAARPRPFDGRRQTDTS